MDRSGQKFKWPTPPHSFSVFVLPFPAQNTHMHTGYTLSITAVLETMNLMKTEIAERIKHLIIIYSFFFLGVH